MLDLPNLTELWSYLDPLKILLPAFISSATSVIIIGVVSHDLRAARKINHELLAKANYIIKTLPYVDREFLRVRYMSVAEERKGVAPTVNILTMSRAAVLVGPHRAGKTVGLCHHVLHALYPWHVRFLRPPRGVLLLGDQRHSTMEAWLQAQTSTAGKHKRVVSLLDLVLESFSEQKVRGFLMRTFGEKLPILLRPQPFVIIVDQAEELMCKHRADFLVFFYLLIKEQRDTGTLRLIFIVNTDHAVESFKVINGGNLFTEVVAGKPTRESVQEVMGEDFMPIYDACGGNIGLAKDYLARDRIEKSLTPAQFCEMKTRDALEKYTLQSAITAEEYNAVTSKSGDI